ncbi:hypothetical protein D9M72_520780 [compost metagenome]
MLLSEKILLISDSTPGTLRWMCSRRCLPGCAGSATSGKLTDEVEVPLSLYLTSFSATSSPMLACASMVEPPMCGVRITLSSPRSGDWNSSLLVRGSTGNTSMAAPSSFLLLRASASGSISTTVPREAFSRMAPGFMAAISAAPIIHCVAWVSGTCRVTMSLWPSSWCSSRTWRALPSGSLVTTS